VVGEFGCIRTQPGAVDWLKDVVSLIESREWHWAFYSFREDVWPAMDYELGTAKLHWSYWDSVKAGRTPELKRGPNPLWDILQAGLHGRPVPGK